MEYEYSDVEDDEDDDVKEDLLSEMIKGFMDDGDD